MVGREKSRCVDRLVEGDAFARFTNRSFDAALSSDNQKPEDSASGRFMPTQTTASRLRAQVTPTLRTKHTLLADGKDACGKRQAGLVTVRPLHNATQLRSSKPGSRTRAEISAT